MITRIRQFLRRIKNLGKIDILILTCESGFIDELDRLAKASNCSRAEVIDRAIGLYAEALRQAENGMEISFTPPNERTRNFSPGEAFVSWGKGG
jgi:hypothetical protein